MAEICYHYSTRRALRYGLAPIISILAIACVSTEKTPAPASVKPLSHFTLEAGPVETQVDPLPDYIPIYVNAFTGEKQTGRRLGFKGWDFNKDGLIDMLESLDKDGNIVKRSYDWNHDSKIDEVRLVPPK